MNEYINYSFIGNLFMGRPFNDTEKNNIKNLLIAKGRKLFSIHGLKKTTIEDITNEIGIAQGSFYAFFDSKEALYFEILEIEERKLGETLKFSLNSIEINRKNFKQFLLKSLDQILKNPFIKDIVLSDSYQNLLRKIPEDRMKRHLEDEAQLLMETIHVFQEQGVMKKADPYILTGLFHGLFILYLHKKDIGTDIFDQVIDLLLDLISDSLIDTGDRNLR